MAWLLLRPRLFAALALALLLSSLYGVHRFNEWREARSLAHYKAENIALQAQVSGLKVALKREKASERVVVKYVDRLQVVAGRTKTIIKEVPVYVPADSADLPAGFRVLHDAAATGELPDPARIADAAPVAAQDAAATVIDNYGACHANAEQVTALQDWIRAQQAIK